MKCTAGRTDVPSGIMVNLISGRVGADIFSVPQIHAPDISAASKIESDHSPGFFDKSRTLPFKVSTALVNYL